MPKLLHFVKDKDTAHKIRQYLLELPTVENWDTIKSLLVGPRDHACTVMNAVSAAHPGKWPVVNENGDYEIPNQLQVARALKWTHQLFQRPAPFFPRGGAPTLGESPVTSSYAAGGDV